MQPETKTPILGWPLGQKVFRDLVCLKTGRKLVETRAYGVRWSRVWWTFAEDVAEWYGNDATADEVGIEETEDGNELVTVRGEVVGLYVDATPGDASSVLMAAE